MSSLASLPGLLSMSSPTAQVRVLYPGRWPRSKYKSAHVLVSGRIYWKVARRGATNQPLSPLDFRNVNSLELVRLTDGGWKEVDEIVKVSNHDGRPRITVRGHLQGRTRRKALFLVRDVELEIIPSSREQHEAWVNNIRARIAPWNLLQQEMKDASGVEELEIALGGLASSRVAPKPSSMSNDDIEEKRSDVLGSLPEQLQKLSIVEKLTTHGTAAVGLAEPIEKLVSSAEHVTEIAELLANLSKCVAGVSTIFQLVSLSAQSVSMWAEANRGQRMLPVALGQMTILLRYVLESFSVINKPSRSVNDIDTEFVFDTFKEMICIMDEAETQLLRGGGSQIINAENVKEVEKKLKELIHRVVTAGNVSKIYAMDEKMNRSEEGREVWIDGPHHVRPSVSAFFSGRKNELKALKEMLEKWGSAVITQYGGVGKTELMVAFADRAEREQQVPGGVFWVMVDGDVRNVIGALAELAENLTRRRMSEEDRRNAKLVIAVLKQGLDEREGRWLLCLDNADDSRVSGVLNEVCGIVGPVRGNGWVVVTSRQGQPHIWERMKSEQKLALEPLCAEDAMVALWRRVRKIERDDADDDKVISEINELKGVDRAEYYSLKKLCGDDSGHGLGGLPLALVQAGSFIAQFNYSYGEYLNLFESANKDCEDVMNKTEDLKCIRESQRSIWTTWKISVQKLSEKAYTTLRAMAMLGQGGIGETVVNEILKAVAADGGSNVEEMLRNVVDKELVHGSSLICRDIVEEERRRTYKMHRLVQRFILSSMMRGSELWNQVYSLVLPAVHECVRIELEKEGNSFSELPDVFKNNHYEFATHALALVHHHTLRRHGNEMQHVSEVEDIHWYSGMMMASMGKCEEEIEVWEHLLVILQYQQGGNRRGGCIERFLDVRYRRKQARGLKSRITNVYGFLGVAFMNAGKLVSAISKLEESLEMRRAIYGARTAHPDIAASLNNLGSVYKEMGELEKALEKYEESLEMRRAIYGERTAHPHIAASLNNLGSVYEQMGELEKALEKYEESLEMTRAIEGEKMAHSALPILLLNI